MEKNPQLSVPGLLFKRFASKKLEAKILKDRIKNRNPQASKELDSLINDLQRLKNSYSFGKNQYAGVTADEFASKLRTLEARLGALSGKSPDLSA